MIEKLQLGLLYAVLLYASFMSIIQGIMYNFGVDLVDSVADPSGAVAILFFGFGGLVAGLVASGFVVKLLVDEL